MTEPVVVICAGHFGALEPRHAADLAGDIVSAPVQGDLVSGSWAGPVELVAADDVLRAA